MKREVRKNGREIKCHDRRKKKAAWLVMEAGKQIKQIKVKKSVGKRKEKETGGIKGNRWKR